MVEKLNRLAFQADWASPGLKEGVILTGQQTPEGITDSYLSRGIKAVVIRTGYDGVWLKSASGEQGMADVIKAGNVVDTIGVGGGFAVGIISALLEDKALSQAVNRDDRIGSLTIQVQGDNERLPTRDTLGGWHLYTIITAALHPTCSAAQ